MRTLLAFLLPIIAFSQTDTNSLLWKISGNGLDEPSFLYGTMHVSDERVFDFTVNTDEAFTNAHTVALELNLKDVNLLELMDAMLMDSSSLEQLLDSSEYNLVDTYFKDSIGLPLSFYNKFIPMFTNLMIGERGNVTGEQRDLALDEYFQERAEEEQKEVVGLESMDEQLNAFRSIDLSYQAQMLFESVNSKYNPDTSETERRNIDIVELYLEGNVDQLAEMFNDKSIDSAYASQLNEIFLVKRNENMFERAVPLIRQHSTFIAIGAAHLGGPHGLIALFRGAGYKVEAQ